MARPTPWKPGPYVLAPGAKPNVVIASPIVTAPTETPPAVQVLYTGPATVAKPPHARNAGQRWSVVERTLVKGAFQTAGLCAAYQAAAHRTRPAVRGFLQRAGLVPRQPKKPAFTP